MTTSHYTVSVEQVSCGLSWMYLARVLSEMMRQNQPDCLQGPGGTMLARITKHIPKASELQMLTVFLITNIFSGPAH